MNIDELKPEMGDVNITVTVKDKGEVREFEKFGNEGRVCTAVAKDDTGEIDLTLWNEDIDEVEVGDKVKIENGWISEYQGEPQLTKGKYGELTIVEESSESFDESEDEDLEDDVDDEEIEQVGEEETIG